MVTFDWFIITELSVFLIALYTYKVCTRRRKRYGLGSQVLGLSNGWNLASPSLSFLLCTHRVYNLHSPARGSGSHCPCEKLLELDTVDFLPSCNVLTSLKHSVNYSWDLKRNKYSYIHQSQWGVNKSAQKNTFSVKGSSKQEVFIGEEKRFCKAALGIFYKLYSYSRKAPSKEVKDRVTPDKPTGNSEPAGKQTRLSGSGVQRELLTV